MMKMAIMVASDAGVRVAERIRQEWGQVEVFSVEEREGCVRVDSFLCLLERWGFACGR